MSLDTFRAHRYEKPKTVNDGLHTAPTSASHPGGLRKITLGYATAEFWSTSVDVNVTRKTDRQTGGQTSQKNMFGSLGDANVVSQQVLFSMIRSGLLQCPLLVSIGLFWALPSTRGIHWSKNTPSSFHDKTPHARFHSVSVACLIRQKRKPGSRELFLLSSTRSLTSPMSPLRAALAAASQGPATLRRCRVYVLPRVLNVNGGELGDSEKHSRCYNTACGHKCDMHTLNTESYEDDH
ncbi:uncharacterized protein BT62DRAFT_1011166 [Guyanagaster necrorhizus]|uniref:Uncharacterized protein n=1 Tax=Guyanagaster necrorhizus TaxID=856835 RepID=A0A9P7VIS6_9AGAR|nr:uncharacterized protein BT62DRAFT_1011166 [Guyanagaster necrorhizus MCA 3950]KAG7441853.1 hypothetical protein BT62DRAFT_1011166 [Guyanagaster necrorhizus MCA 3950]